MRIDRYARRGRFGNEAPQRTLAAFSAAPTVLYTDQRVQFLPGFDASSLRSRTSPELRSREAGVQTLQHRPARSSHDQQGMKSTSRLGKRARQTEKVGSVRTARSACAEWRKSWHGSPSIASYGTNDSDDWTGCRELKRRRRSMDAKRGVSPTHEDRRLWNESSVSSSSRELSTSGAHRVRAWPSPRCSSSGG